MTGISGKTYSILSRLAHFHQAEEAGEVLLQLTELLGRALERAEADEYAVQRAHYVETAENEGYRGYTAPAALRGDLDKILALYLEALGGTSSLVKTSPAVAASSLDARLLVDRFLEDDPLMTWLIEKFARQLQAAWQRNDGVAQGVARDIRVDLSSADGWKIAAQGFRRFLLGFSAGALQISEEQITPGFALKLLLGQPPVAAYIRDRLSKPVRALLGQFDGGLQMPADLATALAGELNRSTLRDPGLYRRNQVSFPLDQLPVSATILVRSIYLDDVRASYQTEPNPTRRQQLLDSLATVEPAPSPAGDDQLRLNRMLLSIAFPEYWTVLEVPTLEQVRNVLAVALNLLLDAGELYRTDLFPDIADDYAAWQVRYAGEPVWVNRRLLESAFPSELDKSYVPYRERLRGLIQVLRNGASTRQGILDVVAANLGIVGDDPQARSAKASISIKEYNREQSLIFDGDLALFQEFSPNNGNAEAVIPEVWIKVLDIPFGLANVRIVDNDTGKTVTAPARLNPGDTLVFKGDTVLVNTVALPQRTDGVPEFRPGRSRWHFEADLVLDESHPAGRFDIGDFDDFAFAPDTVVVNLSVLSYYDTPGVFTVEIPWHIPGYTDKFEETPDHPRNQILSIVNRVRAAGVKAHIDYFQTFSETHDHAAKLGASVAGKLLHEDLAMADSLHACNTQRTRESHDITDSLGVNGVFDYTHFDTLYTFAD